jgi:DNA-binding CsgD family transcriptional regulator
MAKQAKTITRKPTSGGSSNGNATPTASKKGRTSLKPQAHATPSPTMSGASIGAADLPLEQVQAMLRLVGETAELWYDPKLQRKYMLESLCRLLNARAGICFGFGDQLTGGAQPAGALMEAGLEDAQRQAVAAYVASGQPVDPTLAALMRLSHDAGYSAVATVIAKRREDLIDDAAWNESDHLKHLRQPLGLPRALYARIEVPGRSVILQLMRASEDPAFTESDRHLLELCISQMSWPHQPEDAPTDPRIEALQPRLRKVMKHLLEGDGEKQVAAKLGLSRHTVHEYVKMLYQQLGVSSRSELLSQFVGRV